MPVFLLFLFFLVFPFGQLLRIELLPSIVLQPLDVISGLIVSYWFLNGGDKKVKNDYLVPFAAVAFFSLLINFQTVSIANFTVGSFYFFRLLAYALFFFAIQDIVRQSNFWEKNIIKAMLVSGFMIVVFGFVQYIVYPDFKDLSDWGWDVHYFRLASTFFDTGFAGILIVLFLILLLAKGVDREIGLKELLFVIPGIVALALTYSRASYLAFIVSMFINYIVRRNLKFTAFVFILFAVSVALLPRPGGEGVRLERTSTVVKRAENFNESLNIIINKPLFGVGYDLLRYNRGEIDTRSHSAAGAASSYIFILATTGVVGILVYLSCLVNIFKTGISKLKSSTGLAMVASLGAVMAHSIFDNSLFYPWVLGWIAILYAQVKEYK